MVKRMTRGAEEFHTTNLFRTWIVQHIPANDELRHETRAIENEAAAVAVAATADDEEFPFIHNSDSGLPHFWPNHRPQIRFARSAYSQRRQIK